MGEIKAIETAYNGHRFRSRLEARWAVFFDDVGIRYHYEPEGFVKEFNGESICYLPDFYFPTWDIYGEVKPSFSKLKEDEKKIAAMIDSNGPCANGILILGQIPYIKAVDIPYFMLFNYSDYAKCIEIDSVTITQHGYLAHCNMMPTLISNAPYLPLDSEYWTFSTLVEKDVMGDLYALGEFAHKEDGTTWYMSFNDCPDRSFEKAIGARFEFGETPEVI